MAVQRRHDGHGVTRLFSYHVAEEVSDGRLVPLLTRDEPDPVPVHLIAPQGRLQVPKVRAFVDFALPRLRDYFRHRAELCANAGHSS
jgi:DNA-binding transcriptional LysR family regulator